MPTTKILLIGLSNTVLQNAQSHITNPDIEIHTTTDIDSVRSIITAQSNSIVNIPIHHVFMGAGIELEQRLEIVREILTSSAFTSIHMKDAASGPQGFLPFVAGVLKGL